MWTGIFGHRAPRRGLMPTLALLLSLLPASPPRADIPRVRWLDGLPFAQVQAEASPTNTLVFVVFNAPWCGFCRRMEKETLANPIVREALMPFLGARYDVETPVGGETALRFNVVGLPGLLVVNSSGEVLARESGFIDVQRLVRFLEDARTMTLSPEELAEKAFQPNASPEIVVRAAQALLDRGREAEARELFQGLAAHGEAGSVAVTQSLLALASLDARTSGTDAAIATLRRATAEGRDPDLLREGYTFLVTLLKNSDRGAEEAVAWDEFAARLPSDPVVQEDYVRALLKIGAAPQKVFDAAVRAEQLAPDDPWPKGGKAEALLRLGRPAEAMEVVGEAIRLGPEEESFRVLRLRIMEALRPAGPGASVEKRTRREK